MAAQNTHILAQRAISLLASPRACMAALDDGFAIFRGADRRRRPALVLARALGEEWIAQGLVRQAGPHTYRLREMPAAPRVGEISAREKPGPNSRGLAGLEAHEAGALARLSTDLEASQAGALRGVDWSTPSRARSYGPNHNPLPAGAAARGRARQALAALAQPLADVAQTLCTERISSLEALERRMRWPARSAKLAIKLVAAQLAHHYRHHAPAGAD